MNINIETRFNIGDEVYIAEFYDDFFPNPKKYTVCEIVARTFGGDISVTYMLAADKEEYIVSETDKCLFSTYEECTKWCNEHN